MNKKEQKIFNFYDFKQQPIEKDVKVMDWQMCRKNTVNKILIGYNRRNKDAYAYVDAYAELTLDEFYDSIKGVPRDILYKWSVHGGRGIPAILPLYAYHHKENLNEYNSGLFLLNTEFKCGEIIGKIPALFDTGASMTHITLALWKKSGMAEQFLQRYKDICNLLGFYNVEDFGKIRDLVAERNNEDSFLLPLKEFSTGVGDGTKRRTYQMRMDELILYNNKLGSGDPVIVNNIDVRIIESVHESFMIGENVINYLTTQMGPLDDNFEILIDFTENGKRLMEKHRKTKNINAMQDMYLLDDNIDE